MTRIECAGPPSAFVVPNAPEERRDFAFSYNMGQTKTKIPPALGVIPNEREGSQFFALHGPNQRQGLDPSGLRPFGMTNRPCPFGMTRIECAGPPGAFVVSKVPKERRDLDLHCSVILAVAALILFHVHARPMAHVKSDDHHF